MDKFETVIEKYSVTITVDFHLLCTESLEGSGLDTCDETGICIDGVCAECSTESGLPESCGSGLYCNDLGAFKFCENTCKLYDTCV
jgi:hypothetical protein